MSEVRTGEYAKYSNPLIDDLRSMHAWLWDCGPEKPKPPARPVAPKGKEGDPEFDLAKVEFAEDLDNYQAALKKWKADKEEFAEFENRYGGPIERRFWSVDARDAILNDLKAVFDKRQNKPRYYVSMRTSKFLRANLMARFQDVLQREGVKLDLTFGLPEGMAPGHGHKAEIERQIAGEKDFVEIMKRDPQFGQEMEV